MKGKINLKTIIIFSVLILVIILAVLGVNVVKTFMSGATAGYEPQNLTNVPGEDGKTATISWVTDKAVKASIFYGTNMASLLLMAEDSEPTIDHNILLTNLRSNTSYYYKIVIDNDNVFDNGGTMYNFKTSGKTEEVVTKTITPTITPTVTAKTTNTVTNPSTCVKNIDYNKDGVINSLDYRLCLTGKITPSAADKCQIGGTYKNLPITNSSEMLKCLRKQ